MGIRENLHLVKLSRGLKETQYPRTARGSRVGRVGKDPTIKILEKAHHRNGVMGTSFNVVKFKDPDEGEMVGIVFPAKGCVAVFNLEKLAQGDIGFGTNSWRGDIYETQLRAAVHDPEDDEPLEEGRDRWKPVGPTASEPGVEPEPVSAPVTIPRRRDIDEEVRQILDGKMTRKAERWDEVGSVEVTEEEAKVIGQLPAFFIDSEDFDKTSPGRCLSGFDSELDDFIDSDGTIFILRPSDGLIGDGGSVFVVDTQGSAYARYAAKLYAGDLAV